MRAIGYQTSLPITDPASLTDIDLPRPEPTGHDLLVRVEAVSVNPVDTKVRMRAEPEPGQWKVLGWDAAGTVEAVGPEVSLFRPREAVFYAGALGRPGTNAEFHLVDERIVGRKPASLGFAEAAALPLTAITAWEALFDRLDVRMPVPGATSAILIIGGAGGVKVHPLVLNLMGKTEPKAGLEGKFSVFHAVAVATVTGRAGEQAFTDKAVTDPTVVALRNKVSAT